MACLWAVAGRHGQIGFVSRNPCRVHRVWRRVDHSPERPSTARVLVAGQSLPTFGTRNVTKRLRLRDGESNLLAGVLRKQDRQTLKGLTGLKCQPVLRQRSRPPTIWCRTPTSSWC